MVRITRTPLVVAAAIAAVGASLAAPALASTEPETTDGASGTESVEATYPPNTADEVAAESGEPVTLDLVGFAVPEAGNEAAQAAFAETPEGAGVEWLTSYGASGDQSRAVADGKAADYVHFSQSGDVTRLVDAGLVAETWDDGPNHGIATDSVVVLVVRPGNPEGIEGWDDLIGEGIEIVTPNPGSSGAARWNILAGWGAVTANGGTEEDAAAYFADFFANVVALPGSGREATTAFLEGTGDVLISYENEAILARQNGAEIDYVVPSTTLLIENPAAVLIDADPHAQAYLNFVLSPEGQAAFATVGFRPIDGTLPHDEVTGIEGANDPDNPFPAPETLLTIDGDFGGWSEAGAKYFNEDDGIITLIQQEAGRT
ncbi:sulfate ABC transporter substrate-binding protein [Desertimonas flava]|uniref:sulfate ABC transporter substrate-binding protein n=1 Tax=Desertimonas flava TaxID=2064846 RepID=UPI001968D3D9|nr:sulfate ABC transporter substrate-binding protein [Desertimonas flava]